MKKQEAISLFGSKQQHLANAVGRGRSAISQWNDELTQDQINLVLGSAVRLGKKIPKKFIDKLEQQCKE